jgi:GR25 family glycosyltransferase involved in LPS biosynthesis
MNVIYINLKRATERNRSFLTSYAQSGLTSSWNLHRFEAVTGNSSIVGERPGNCSPSLKGNYLSHLGCIQHSASFGSHVLISEDDTEFSTQTRPWIERILAQLPDDSWDVILTDVFVSSAVDMPGLLKIRRRCMEKSVVSLIDPSAWSVPFAGAGSYILNRNSAQKVLAALDLPRLDYAFDLMLREAIRSRKLNGLVVYPFLTTVAECADESSVQADSAAKQNILWNRFRRLVWIGNPLRTLPDVNGGNPDQQMDPEVAEMMAILGPLLSMQMVWGGEPQVTVPAAR